MRLGKTRLLFVAAAIAVLGALLLVGNVLAQTPTPTTGNTDFNFADRFLTHLAQSLGIDKSQLVDQMKTAAKTTVDDATQQGTLTEEQANRLKDRIDQASPERFAGSFFGPKHRPHPRLGMVKPGRFGFGRGLFGDLWDAAAQKLGLTTDQLRTELQAGKSLAQIAEEKGESRDDLKAALVEAQRTPVQQAVEEGRLTQEQADRILANLENRVDRIIDAAPHQRHQRTMPTPSPSGA